MRISKSSENARQHLDGPTCCTLSISDLKMRLWLGRLSLRANASIAKVFDDKFKGSMKWEVKAIEILRSRVLLPGQDIKFSWESLLSSSTEEAILRS